MDVIKTIAYELQPCRPQDIATLYRWTVINMRSLYQHVPVKTFITQTLHYLRAVDIRKLMLGLTWCCLWLCAIYWFGMGSLYLMLSIAGVMMMNFDDRKANSLSAYSIFNRGYQRLLGTMTAEQFERERIGNYNYHNDDGNNVFEVFQDDVESNDDNNDEQEAVQNIHEEKHKKRHKGKKSRRNYEERKRRKEQYQQLLREQVQQIGGNFDD